MSSGYRSVQALPLTWHGQTFGALNVFRADAAGFEHQQPDCRALADAVTLLIVSAHVDHDHLAAGLRAALEDRALVEHAKGALAHTRSLDMAEAFDALVALADEEGVTPRRGGPPGHGPGALRHPRRATGRLMTLVAGVRSALDDPLRHLAQLDVVVLRGALEAARTPSVGVQRCRSTRMPTA